MKARTWMIPVVIVFLAVVALARPFALAPSANAEVHPPTPLPSLAPTPTPHILWSLWGLSWGMKEDAFLAHVTPILGPSLQKGTSDLPNIAFFRSAENVEGVRLFGCSVNSFYAGFSSDGRYRSLRVLLSYDVNLEDPLESQFAFCEALLKGMTEELDAPVKGIAHVIPAEGESHRFPLPWDGLNLNRDDLSMILQDFQKVYLSAQVGNVNLYLGLSHSLTVKGQAPVLTATVTASEEWVPPYDESLLERYEDYRAAIAAPNASPSDSGL